MLLSHTRYVNNISKVRSSLHKLADLKKSNSGIHKENGTMRLRVDEVCVQNTLECLEEWGSDPFDLTNTALRTLHSGEIASTELCADFSSSLSDGQIQMKSFIEERLFSQETAFSATVHLNNRLTFNKPPHSDKCSIKKMKTAEMETKAMASVVSMCIENKSIPLKEVLCQRITEKCLIPMELW